MLRVPLEFLIEAVSSLAETIFPNPCLGCGAERAFRAPRLCDPCRLTLVPIGATGCRRCGNDVEHVSSHTSNAGRPVRAASSCRRCRGRPFAFRSTVAGVRYGGTARTLVHELKFHGRREAAPILAEPLIAAIRKRGLERAVDVVVPLPLHFVRRFRRGFDQAESIAQCVASGIGLPLVRFAIWRRRALPPRSLLPKGTRHDELAGVFAPGRRRKAVAGLSVLLVDDVLTSGATAHAAASALLAAGARRVHVAVAAT